MKKTIAVSSLALLLAATPATAQMMGSGQHMYQQQKTQQQQNNPYRTNPYMMGGYGYNMGPQMMGGYGYGMGPQMMGGYGYGMGPQMMGGYGYPMHPNMMGGYGYGMGHHMMGGYGMGSHMMGGCGLHGPYNAWQGPYFKSGEDYGKFLDETRELRRQMHTMMFDYSEVARNPEPDREKLQEMEEEMQELREKIFKFKTK